jgi:hypothetical protein
MSAISWLMAFAGITAVYSESSTKDTSALCGQNEKLQTVKEGAACSYHGALKF